MTPKEVFKFMADKGVKFIDLRFTDTRGKEQHVSVPIASFGPEKFDSGHYFDGSSIAGWKGIQASDMVLLPDPTSCFIDPFLEKTTLAVTCDVNRATELGRANERCAQEYERQGYVRGYPWPPP